MDEDVEEELVAQGTVLATAVATVLDEEIVLEEGVADLGDPMEL